MTARFFVGVALFGLALVVGWLGYRRRDRALVFWGQAIGWSSVAVGEGGWFGSMAAVLAIWTGADAWRTKKAAR